MKTELIHTNTKTHRIYLKLCILIKKNSLIYTNLYIYSLPSLSDIVYEEDEVLHSDNDLQNWSIPKVDKKRGL